MKFLEVRDRMNRLIERTYNRVDEEGWQWTLKSYKCVGTMTTKDSEMAMYEVRYTVAAPGDGIDSAIAHIAGHIDSRGVFHTITHSVYEAE